MPTKNEAMQRPANLGEVITPATPFAQNVPPIIPREQPGLGPASLGPAPSVWTSDYDRVRQWARPGTAQGRFPVLPTKNNPQLNASSSGVAARKVRPIAAQSSANAAAIVALRAASVFEGTWSSTTSYVAGNSVLYTNAGVTAFYVAIGSSTNKIPSSSPTFWQVTGSSSTYVNLGAYNGATTYFPGNQVTYNPSGGGSQYWICISQTTGNAPSQASSFWELVGTSAANLNGLDGVTPTGAGGLNLVFNGDFSIATVPTGVQSATASAIRVQDLQNGGGIEPSCNGWTRNFESGGNGEGVIYQITTPASAGLVGPYSLILQDRTGSTGDLFAAVCDAFSVQQNTPYTFAANVNPGYGGLGGIPTHAAWYFRVLWYKVGATDFSRSSSDLISFADIVSASTASGPQSPSGTVTSPAAAGFCRIAFYHFYDLVTPPTSGWNLAVSNVRCVAPIDPSNLGQILAKGSTPSSLSSGFTFTSTPTSVNISWTSLQIFRADGSVTSVANGNQTITGLSASSSFRMYPFFDDLASSPTFGTLQFVNVSGGTGSPALCYAAGSNLTSQAQNLQSRIPLSSSTGITVTTPASGSSGGSGGGSSNCLHESMLCETQRGILPISDVQVGDKVLGEHDQWQEVTFKIVKPCEVFICITLTDGSSITASTTHPFTLADRSMKRSADLALSDFLITRNGGVGVIKSISVVQTRARKVSLTVEPSHIFYASSDAPPRIASHNWLPS
jgi:hypothetical protein